MSEKSTREALGIAAMALTPQIARQVRADEDLQAVVIAAVDPSSDAAQKGLRRGDIILSANNKQVKTPEELDAIIADIQSSGREAVLLQVQRRGGQPAYLPVRLRDK